MTLPSDKRNFTLALELAGIIWLIKARNKSHMGAAHVTEGSQCLVLLACHGQVSDRIMTRFKTQCWGTSTHTKRAIQVVPLSLRISHSTNQAQTSLHYECFPKNQFLSVLQRNSIKGDLILGSLGGEELLKAPYLI